MCGDNTIHLKAQVLSCEIQLVQGGVSGDFNVVKSVQEKW
jgi:hypothetical protein